MRSIVKLKFGSEIYGTKLPTSDEDIKAVHIPTPEEIILNTKKDCINKQKQIIEGKEVDFESYSLNYFLKLLCQGQTPVLDMLFTPKEFWIEYSQEWEYIVAHKHKFISKSIYPFVGYCRAQANKYSVKGNRLKETKIALDTIQPYFDNTPLEKMAISFGDFEDLTNTCQHIKFVKKENLHGVVEEYLSICEKQIPKNASIKFGYHMIQNLLNEYGRRSLQTEKDEYDTKALYHAFRVAHEAIELLETGNITFPRPEAGFLLDIRNKKYTYDYLQDKLDEMLRRVEIALETSTLPVKPDCHFSDCLIYLVYKTEILNT